MNVSIMVMCDVKKKKKKKIRAFNAPLNTDITVI